MPSHFALKKVWSRYSNIAYVLCNNMHFKMCMEISGNIKNKTPRLYQETMRRHMQHVWFLHERRLINSVSLFVLVSTDRSVRSCERNCARTTRRIKGQLWTSWHRVKIKRCAQPERAGRGRWRTCWNRLKQHKHYYTINLMCHSIIAVQFDN